MADESVLCGKLRLGPMNSDENPSAISWTLHSQFSHSFRAVSFELPALDDLACPNFNHNAPDQCLIQRAPVSGKIKEITTSGMKPWLDWLHESIRHKETGKREPGIFILILPKDSGHLVRKDILQVRLAGWDSLIAIFSHDEPDSLVIAVSAFSAGLSGFAEVCDTAIGGVLLKAGGKSERFKPLDELSNRLALPLVVDHQTASKRILIVGGGYNLSFRKQLFSAAAGLGMTLIIVDSPGHWLQHGHEAAGVPIEFLPVNMTVDSGLPDRIVAATRSLSSPIHSITTLVDRYLGATARVAGLLSLSGLPSSALETTVDKALMRKQIPLPADCTSSASWPVIVKPTQGSGSFGIFLARNDQEREVAEASLRKLGKTPMTELYQDGPEVDVNIVLHNGEAIATQISDNFPTTAEGFPSQFDTATGSWVETGSIIPSGLPDEEQALLRDSITSNLLRLGFKTGVFHCEARVIRSTMSYDLSSESRFPRLRLKDLATRSSTSDQRPQVAVVELNARPPGQKACEEILYATGIDYLALQLLASCRDDARFCALARPFAKQETGGWWGTGAIPAEKGGRFKPEVMFEELATTSPDLMAGLVRWEVFYKPGEAIADPRLTGRVKWVAWFLVRSTRSRSDLEDVLERVRTALRFDIV